MAIKSPLPVKQGIKKKKKIPISMKIIDDEQRLRVFDDWYIYNWRNCKLLKISANEGNIDPKSHNSLNSNLIRQLAYGDTWQPLMIHEPALYNIIINQLSHAFIRYPSLNFVYWDNETGSKLKLFPVKFKLKHDDLDSFVNFKNKREYFIIA